VPNAYHEPIVYPMALLKAAKQPALAIKFGDYLKSEKASAIFKEYGFTPLGNTANGQ
jgi:molybdate transport system substrate-binding protein